MIAQASNMVTTVDNVFIYIVIISTILLLGVTSAMIYFVIRYNRKRNPKAENIHGNFWLEAVWIFIPTVLALSMFYFGFTGFEILRKVPKDAMVVKVTGQMWKWSFEYPNGKKYDTLYVPVQKSVKLELHSVDVNHAFYIPAFRIKEDVTPGLRNYLVFRAESRGSYDVECAEYCGMKHSYMLNKVVVLSQDEFQSWLNKGISASAKADSTVGAQKAAPAGAANKQAGR